jgi:hypothetical protein
MVEYMVQYGETMKRVYLLLLVLWTAACSPALTSKPADSFGDSHKEFAMRLAWQDYGSAASFLDSEYRPDFQDKFPERGDIRILEIRPEQVEFEGELQARAVSWASIDYYRLPSNTLKSMKVRLEWEYQGKDWKIVSPFPDLP